MMGPKLTIQTICMCLGLVWFSACSHMNQSGRASDLTNGIETIKPEEYAEKIKILEEMQNDTSNPDAMSNTHLKLALLYSSYKNPELDYSKALKHLEIYTSEDPDKAAVYNVQNLLTALREMNHKILETETLNSETEQLKSGYRQLMRENKKMKRFSSKGRKNAKEIKKLKIQMARLKKENQTLNEVIQQLVNNNLTLLETIEKLKNLDLQLEEKRRTFK